MRKGTRGIKRLENGVWKQDEEVKTWDDGIENPKGRERISRLSQCC